MKITDLNFDCLASCLRHLNIAELLDVADCNEQLRYTARYLIKRMINRSTVNVCPSWFMTKENVKFLLNEKGLHMGGDLKFSLQFFRCCGDLVSALEMDALERIDSVKCDRIVNYVNEYCSGFLIEISFIQCPRDSLKRLTKSFCKVETLLMENSFPTGRKLSELFPNLRKMQWNATCELLIFPDEFITDHYPVLEHLTLFVHRCDQYHEKVSLLLLSNPQLKSFESNIWLEITSDGKKNFEILPNLEKLNLKEIRWCKPIDERIHLKNLKELRLCFQNVYKLENTWTIPIISDQLESLEVSVFLNGTVENDIVTRITNYPNSVKKFKFRSNRRNHMEISRVLPSLEEIDLDRYYIYFTVDEVVRFVREFRSLKLLRFRSLASMSMEDLMTHFRSDWSVSFKTCYMGYIQSGQKSGSFSPIRTPIIRISSGAGLSYKERPGFGASSSNSKNSSSNDSTKSNSDSTSNRFNAMRDTFRSQYQPQVYRATEQPFRLQFKIIKNELNKCFLTYDIKYHNR